MSLARRVDGAVDWCVARLSPRAAARRAHMRRLAHDPDYAQTCMALSARGYRGAAEARNSGQWTGGGGTADAQILTDLPTLRNRSRELNRDDSIAAAITKTFVANVIGTGLRPQSRLEDAERAGEIESLWRERCNGLFPAETSDFPSAQRLVFRKVLEDGDHFVRFAQAQPGEPVWCESIEGDRLWHWAYNQTAIVPGSGNQIRQGIEKDPYGRPVRYWILPRPPQDVIGFGQTGVFGSPVPAEAADCLHLKIQERSGQTRGVPLLHAVLGDLRDLDLLLLASLKRTQVAACLAAFIQTPVSASDVFADTAKLIGNKLTQELEPGMIWGLAPGETASFLSPNFPSPDLMQFVALIARKIGAALGISWQLILKDFSGANYSSARTDLLESRSTFLAYQQWFTDSFLTPVWLRVMQDARLRGDPRVATATDEDLCAVTWIAPGWRWVDPLKEARSTALQLQLGITTLRDECAAQGRDWEETLRQIAREQALAKELDVKLGVPAAAAQASDMPASGAGTGDEDIDRGAASMQTHRWLAASGGA